MGCIECMRVARVEPVGLPNPGTQQCYLNSILQSLHASRHYTSYLQHVLDRARVRADVMPVDTCHHAHEPHMTADAASSIVRLVSSLSSLFAGWRTTAAEPCQNQVSSSLSQHVSNYSQHFKTSRQQQGVTQLTDMAHIEPSPTVQRVDDVSKNMPLTYALHQLMQHMQPCPAFVQQQQQQSSVGHAAGFGLRAQQPGVPMHVVRAVLSALSPYMPGGRLQLGEQQDASEAAQAILEAVQYEVYSEQLDAPQPGLSGLLLCADQILSTSSSSGAGNTSCHSSVDGTTPCLRVQSRLQPVSKSNCGSHKDEGTSQPGQGQTRGTGAQTALNGPTSPNCLPVDGKGSGYTDEVDEATSAGASLQAAHEPQTGDGDPAGSELQAQSMGADKTCSQALTDDQADSKQATELTLEQAVSTCNDDQSQPDDGVAATHHSPICELQGTRKQQEMCERQVAYEQHADCVQQPTYKQQVFCEQQRAAAINACEAESARSASASLRLVSPAQGWMSYSITCCRCHNQSVTQITPFWSLSLKLPARMHSATGTAEVQPGANLLACMQAFVQPSPLEGVLCNKCSLTAAYRMIQQHSQPDSQPLTGLAAARRAAGLTAGPSTLPAWTEGQLSLPAGQVKPAKCLYGNAAASPGPEVTEQHMNGSGVHGGNTASLVASLAQLQGPLPDMELYQVIEDAHLLSASKVRGPAVQQVAVCRLPNVLLLHMQRSVWDLAGHCIKVHGHVKFATKITQQELQSALNCSFGPTPASAIHCSSNLTAESSGAMNVVQYGGKSAAVSVVDNTWQLISVVCHLGVGSGQGHYIVYRRGAMPVDSPDTTIDDKEPVASSQWFMVSDSLVRPVNEAEVLSCQASILVYERT